MEKYQSFEFVKKLSFVRTSGSKEELDAANLIKNECEILGYEAKLEEFLVDGYNINKVELSFPNTNINYECVGVGMSSSTPDDGIEGPFFYVNSKMDAEIKDLKGAICLIHSKIVEYKLYKKLVDKGVAGLILATGSVYSDAKEVDLDPYMYRERHYTNGKIPAVCIRMKDAEDLIKRNPKTCKIVLKQDEFKNKSHNVVCEIKGVKYPDEVICYSAHYDSVSYSKGAYDNATGSATLLQILAYFKGKTPDRTLKFIWCGSEEMGLLGSKAYCNYHEEELKNYKLNINVDMTGAILGYDIARCTASQSLVTYIKYLGYELGFSCVSDAGIYSSDSTSFASKGVPAVSFARISPRGGAEIHSNKDVLDHLSCENYYNTCDFICELSQRLVNSKFFPVEQVIPQKLKDDIEVYLGRKDNE